MSKVKSKRSVRHINMENSKADVKSQKLISINQSKSKMEDINEQSKSKVIEYENERFKADLISKLEYLVSLGIIEGFELKTEKSTESKFK